MTAEGRTAAIVPAAGRGERLGPGAPKALRLLGGAPLLVHAVRALSASHAVGLIVLAVPADQIDEVRVLLDEPGLATEIVIVAGGETRQESVSLALLALPDHIEVVLVHDAARPLVPAELVAAVAAAVHAGNPAVVPGMPLVDTIKRVDDEGHVVVTVDRDVLRAIQTPQGFNRRLLESAHARADGGLATDDAGLVEMAGERVLVIPGHEEGFKVTRPIDLVLAEALLARRRAAGQVA
ncbi:MAG: 2-C-methyl-D-erythritol 4-phosphate cytidylyltransferase [Actinobacteria bacterium]|uniref:2-C-methyl-D-erythritol 4-phosphate cytidylyltransferase n=1 Tax=freshwater metagenome TaxID=449393 RepID=A0A6J6SN68_9ZZZZ|nr:2-C-methyl-D-erythritol 4-phosphate cytidylyltransferase [Actinomycetota bacterium]MSY94317.1 2-C-methyl-D-erythritol 4-phosphate cytidylyltransferase [Actinomycetota bacterium]